jgi:hypothetical protein
MPNDTTLWRKIPWIERPWIVYLIVRDIQPDATSLAIRAEIERRHGYRVSLGWLYDKLENFEKTGYLRVEKRNVSDPQTHLDRGGRPAWFYFPTSKRRPDKAVKSIPTSVGDWQAAP